MATCSVIARPAGGGWAGRTCRHDGHPAHQGRILFAAVTGHFGGDVHAAGRYLIDQHPAGWARLGGDFSRPAGYVRGPADPGRNQCYCHGDRVDAPQPLLTSGDALGRGARYGYVLEEPGLRVLAAAGGRWIAVTLAAWDRPPDWTAIQTRAADRTGQPPRPTPRPGARIRLVAIADPHTDLAPGSFGTVAVVDDLGTVHVTWDDGRRLGLIPGSDDFEVVAEPGDTRNP